jgi:hypothetical protein
MLISQGNSILKVSLICARIFFTNDDSMVLKKNSSSSYFDPLLLKAITADR